ncbi:PP2C family protein-serine/threonine phosphatase [Streptomyces sp. NPDC058867]|uniref:PP2C family protein-serine/threonine phosphatase n=1 Tax=unclassified Streptomyces TaxID=2593676 RepID=UPI0036B81453
MSADEGLTCDAPDWWWRALHLLWCEATAEVRDVTGVAETVYRTLVRLPGVVAVAGARWDDSGPLYMRRMCPGQEEAVTWLASSDDWPGGPVCPPVIAGSAAPRALLLDLDASGPQGDLPGTVLRAAGARWAVECVFPLADRDSAGLWLGLAEQPREPEADRFGEQLTQVADVLRTGNQRILEVRENERRNARDAFLAEASLQLDTSLDARETLHRVARLAVPAVAEGCAVHLLRTNGSLEPVAVAHVSARAQEWLADAVSGDPWLRTVLERGAMGREGLLLRGADLAGGPFGGHVDSGFGAAVGAVSVSPLRARGRVLGTLTFWYERESAGVTDLRMLDDLATRAALAIDTTTLYEQRRQHVHLLQQHLLPRALPKTEGLELSAAYHVGDASLDVGGDFYDVVRSGERVALVIGDVCGRGAEAAAATALARYTLRTLLEDGTPPGHALSRLNQALTAESASRFLTALVAVLTPEAGGWTAEIAGAGHPWPLLRGAGGQVTEVPARGALLGVIPETDYRSVRLRLEEGDALVLFTDGLTEARSLDGTHFEVHLFDEVAKFAASGERAAAELVAAAAGFRAQGDDDTAVLVAKVRGPN